MSKEVITWQLLADALARAVDRTLQKSNAKSTGFNEYNVLTPSSRRELAKVLDGYKLCCKKVRVDYEPP